MRGAEQRVDFLATNRNPAKFRQDASFVYRCENLAEALKATGHGARLQHISGYRPSARARAVVLHRPQYSARLHWLLRQVRRAGSRVVIDLDDLIFDPAFASCSPAVVNGILPLRKIWLRFLRHGLALRLVDAVTVSTERLAVHLRRLLPQLPVLVIPNSVHMSWRALPDPGADRALTDLKLITYSPGTRSHDKDFEQIAPVLGRFLHAHPQVRLQITGPLNHGLRAREAQVGHSPRVPFGEYAERVRCGWVNLCPLEPSPFNECKSAIKVIEAGYWNIPTLCSPNPDCERFTSAGAIIASTEQDWFEALELLVDDAYYARKSDRLSERTLALADAEVQAQALLDLVERAGD